jgi:hypothetical protein
MGETSPSVTGEVLSPTTWENVLTRAWERVRDQVEVTGELRFAHEHTLQFHFAWEVARLCGFQDSLSVRFEVLCGVDSHGETIRTDLLFWSDPKFKIAVEMKAPIRSESGMNSAMTYTRMAFYRDVLIASAIWSRRAGRTSDEACSSPS